MHTRSDIKYITRMLGRYLNNPGLDHWKTAKMVLRYLQRTKHHMLTYRRSIRLENIGYTDSDFCGMSGQQEVHYRLHFHVSRRSYFNEKVQSSH
jgi:hypothetical protein